MKRNIIENLKKWSEGESVPFFLYGLEGVGKTYVVNEYTNDFCGYSIYFKTEKDSAYYEPFLSSFDPFSFVTAHLDMDPEVLLKSVVIFDDCEDYPETAKKLIEMAFEKKCRWIFVSSYDLIPAGYEDKVSKHKMFPMQFDEYLIANGNEWYVEAIKAHFESGKKLPDMVHSELLSDFEEYMWVGGMPDAVSHYISSKNAVNISKIQYRAKIQALYHLPLKAEQIISVLEKQLYKPNQKFMFQLIRTGVTYKMYEDAIEYLIEQGILIRQNELEDERKFKLLFSEFSFLSCSRNDEITDVEYDLRLQNYVLQTLNSKEKTCFFWESGNRAELPFILKNESGYCVIDASNAERSKSRSVSSFLKTHENAEVLTVNTGNFKDNNGQKNIPVYSLFCL